MNRNCGEPMSTPLAALAKLLDYIEFHLYHPIQLEQLAHESGLSRFQLIRLFGRICGMPPMEYIRARRLAGSIPWLLRGDRVLDVALQSGFEHEQSYIRAFREAYRITPAQFRRGKEPVPLTEVPRLDGFTVTANGLTGQPILLARPAFTAKGQLRQFNYADNLLDGLPLREGLRHWNGERFTAFCRPSGTDRFMHEYLVMSASADDPVEWKVPAGEWVQFKYIGLHHLDREGIRRMRLQVALVAGSWFSERGRRWSGCFMENVERSWLGEDYSEVEISCPLDA